MIKSNNSKRDVELEKKDPKVSTSNGKESNFQNFRQGVPPFKGMKRLDRATQEKLVWVALPVPILALVGCFLREFPEWLVNAMWVDIALFFVVWVALCIKQKCWREIGLISLYAIMTAVTFLYLFRIIAPPPDPPTHQEIRIPENRNSESISNLIDAEGMMITHAS